LLTLDPTLAVPSNSLRFIVNSVMNKSHERVAEMNVEMPISPDKYSHYGSELPLVRVLAGHVGWLTAGPGWTLLRQAPDRQGDAVSTAGDCWLIESGEAAAISVDDLGKTGLPLVVALAADTADTVDQQIMDRADAFIFEGDTPAVIGALLRSVTTPAGFAVRETSENSARMINALSAEAGRIADQLARLAEAQRDTVPSVRPVDAVLIRRMLRLRRERERYFPAEIFADPAWDMLLDLTAAQLEGRLVPVSSLCIAAAVPTTTALRWVRSLTEAGLMERQLDPADARRSHIRLSDDASAAMLSYLRAFSEIFALR
jgi:Winged helix DNA-binding domain